MGSTVRARVGPVVPKGELSDLSGGGDGSETGAQATPLVHHATVYIYHGVTRLPVTTPFKAVSHQFSLNVPPDHHW